MNMNDLIQALGDPSRFSAGNPDLAKVLSSEMSGHMVAQSNLTPQTRAAIAAFTDIRDGYMPNHNRQTRLSQHARDYMLAQAVSTEDFPYIFATILDREVFAAYNPASSAMRKVVRVKSGRDFRTRERFQVQGGEALLQKQGKGAPVEQIDKPSEQRWTYNVDVYSKKFDTTWQDLVDDQGDLDVFADLPKRLGNAAIATEDNFLTSLFVGASGWNTSYFATGNGTVAPLATPLTIDNLISAYGRMAKFRTPVNSLPRPVRPKYLMVPPALALQAESILGSTQRVMVYGGDDETAAASFGTKNVASQLGLEIIVNPWIPYVATTGTYGDTMWALFADPNEAPVPAAEFGLLRGYERPTIYLKTPNQSRIGGGGAPAMMGDFDTMGVSWKVMHTFGGVVMDGRAAIASNGQ